MKSIKEQCEELNKRIEAVEKILEKKDEQWNYNRPIEEYWEHVKSERDELKKLSRELRKIQPYTLQKLSDFGNVMSLKHFVECVKESGFIDYDGWGYYVKDGKETNIQVIPSDVDHNILRDEEFDTIIWFNR